MKYGKQNKASPLGRDVPPQCRLGNRITGATPTCADGGYPEIRAWWAELSLTPTRDDGPATEWLHKYTWQHASDRDEEPEGLRGRTQERQEKAQQWLR